MVTRASAKKKGSGFERLVADYLKEHWSEFIDRRVKTGAKDKGDIANFRVNGREVVIECKNVSKFDLGSWVSEAREEAINAGAMAGIVVFKRPRVTSPEDQYVLLTLGDLITILANTTR